MPAGALALLILSDQFPRNAYRGTSRMYATDPLARRLKQVIWIVLSQRYACSSAFLSRIRRSYQIRRSPSCSMRSWANPGWNMLKVIATSSGTLVVSRTAIRSSVAR